MRRVAFASDGVAFSTMTIFSSGMRKMSITGDPCRPSSIYLAEDVQLDREIIILRAKDPYLAYTRALRLFHPEPTVQPFIHQTAAIDPSAQVASTSYIGANVVLGADVKIADYVKIHPNVTIYDDVEIGAGSIIHSGVSIREGSRLGARVVVYNNAVIGCDGFGYAKDEEGHWLKIPQAGRVVIEDDVDADELLEHGQHDADPDDLAHAEEAAAAAAERCSASIRMIFVINADNL